MSDTLTVMVDVSLTVEKTRVAAQVRQSHLALQGRTDIETEALIAKVQELEDYVDGRVAVLVKDHPAYPWFSRVKGVGGENIGKVVGPLRVKPERGFRKDPDGEGLVEVDLPFAASISAVWKFCGYAPENGVSAHREEGKTLSYNSQLRSMCWRLEGSLIKAGGCFYDYYKQQKERYLATYAAQGIKVIPSPLTKWFCSNCGTAAKLKSGLNKCCDKPTPTVKKREEPAGVKWLGHVDNMAKRKMIKLFLSCLWLTWRAAEGLPVTTPYAIGVLGHDTFIDPWKMVDREMPKLKRARAPQKQKQLKPKE